MSLSWTQGSKARAQQDIPRLAVPVGCSGRPVTQPGQVTTVSREDPAVCVHTSLGESSALAAPFLQPELCSRESKLLLQVQRWAPCPMPPDHVLGESSIFFKNFYGCP